MAEVTVVTRKFTVLGSIRSNFYTITGNTGDTLTLGLRTVNMLTSAGGVVTAYTVAAGTNPGQSVITLTGTLGTALPVNVMGT